MRPSLLSPRSARLGAFVVVLFGILSGDCVSADDRFVRINDIIPFTDNGESERGSILDLGHKIGLRDGDIARIRATTGNAWCVEPDGKIKKRVSAALIGNGRVLLTVEHLFSKDDAFSKDHFSYDFMRERKKCYFRNQEETPVKVALDLHRTPIKWYAEDIFNSPEKDLLLISLPSAPTSFKPLPIDPSGEDLADKEKIIAISAHQDYSGLDPAQPIVQLCTNNPAGIEMPGGLYMLDCSATGGASGGVVLAERGGEWKIKAIITRSGDDLKLGRRPFSWDDGSSTVAVKLGGEVLNDASRLAVKK